MSGHKRVWAQTYLGTNVHERLCTDTFVSRHDCDHTIITCQGTNFSGHKRVWAQTSLGTNESGHKQVWAQTVLAWAQACMVTTVSWHKRVWAQKCLY